jgi:hypothetical protein
VANFLLNGETTPSKEVSEEAPEPQITVKKKPTKSTAPVQDLSHIFMLRAFAKSLEERATAMLNLAANLHDYANKKEMKDRFEQKFPTKCLNELVEKQ